MAPRPSAEHKESDENDEDEIDVEENHTKDFLFRVMAIGNTTLDPEEEIPLFKTFEPKGKR